MLEQNEINQSAEKIGALVKTSLVDFPKRVAAALFLHGCNLRCPYCYNKDLVTGSFQDYDAVSFDDVINHLIKRKNVLSGFVISGGEPCTSRFLEKLILKAHNLEYAVKLDTNGTFPDKLKSIFSSKDTLPEFIAMDIKTAPDRYNILGCKNSETILESIKLITDNFSNDKREFRTVLVPTLINKEIIKDIAEILPKDASWQFAKFQPGSCINEEYNNLVPYTQPQIDELISYAKTLIPNAALR